jgi:rubredoxin
MKTNNSGETVMRKWQCAVCGFVYEEEKGLPDEGISPGTSWDDIPDNWQCPECGVTKAEFEMIELDDK